MHAVFCLYTPGGTTPSSPTPAQAETHLLIHTSFALRFARRPPSFRIWGGFLWAYARTGFRRFYDAAAAAIADTMSFYPAAWHYNEYLTEERAMFLRTLSWLVRADALAQGGPNATHVAWLRRVADDLLARQTPLGGLQEAFGDPALCDFCPPAANADYGTTESPVAQSSNDTVTDQLYSNNFALLGLWEAYGATRDDAYARGADRLGAYLASIQASSAALPELSGSWFRTFDYELYDYWGSDADYAWGAVSVESGWTTTWIAAGISMRAINASAWDMLASDANGIDAALFAAICPEFFDTATCARRY